MQNNSIYDSDEKIYVACNPIDLAVGGYALVRCSNSKHHGEVGQIIGSKLKQQKGVDGIVYTLKFSDVDSGVFYGKYLLPVKPLSN